ncbi:phosphate acyltransferase, partial [Barnesiella intestinihominis]
MSFKNRFYHKQRIVLPEGTEERTLQAADRMLADNIAD